MDYSKIFYVNLFDVLFSLGPNNSVLLPFSSYTNGKKLLACKSSQSPNIRPCLDGIRAIAALWIVTTHFDGYFGQTIENVEHNPSIADNKKH